MDIESHIKALKRICRLRGIPVTPQRRIVYEAIIRRGDHPSAEQVFDEVHKQLTNISKATVYRVIDRLIELGLVRRVGQSGMVARFDADLRRHHHFTCRSCGRIVDIHDPQLDAIAIPQTLANSFVIEDFGVHFFGLCTECRGKLGEKSVDNV